MEKLKSRSLRTSFEQLETYIQFMKENPQFLAGKNTPENSNYVNLKWDELSHKLNALKGPKKNGKEWKATLTHWKHQLKSRARKILIDNTIMGGGESSTSKLSSFEERALNVFGIITVRGDDSLPVMGFTDSNIESVDVNTTLEEQVVEGVNLPVSTNPKRKRTYSSVSGELIDCVAKLTRLAEDRAIQEQQLAETRMKNEKEMAETRLAIEKQNADALTRMAEAMFVLAQRDRQ